MLRNQVIVLLALAALLEAGGDAVVRSALHTAHAPTRIGLFAVGAGVLFAYGYTVNAPSWDFGRALGLYVVFFFVIAQLLSWLVFGQTPSRGVVFGGLLIIAGGVVISLEQM